MGAPNVVEAATCLDRFLVQVSQRALPCSCASTAACTLGPSAASASPCSSRTRREAARAGRSVGGELVGPRPGAMIAGGRAGPIGPNRPGRRAAAGRRGRFSCPLSSGKRMETPPGVPMLSGDTLSSSNARPPRGTAHSADRLLCEELPSSRAPPPPVRAHCAPCVGAARRERHGVDAGGDALREPQMASPHCAAACALRFARSRPRRARP